VCGLWVCVLCFTNPASLIPFLQVTAELFESVWAAWMADTRTLIQGFGSLFEQPAQEADTPNSTQGVGPSAGTSPGAGAGGWGGRPGVPLVLSARRRG